MRLVVVLLTFVWINTVAALPRKSCTTYCSGGYRLGAVCVTGYCQCTGVGYNNETCLPEVGSCRILYGQETALGESTSSGTLYSCVGSGENSTYEVHVIGMYENTGSRSTVYPTNVTIQGRSQKPMILVVTSYKAVRWQINGHPNLDLREVLMISVKEADSSVSVSGVSSPESVKVNLTGIRQYGYGDDSGGGYTARILSALKQRFGSVASFSGTYSSRSWTLTLPDDLQDTFLNIGDGSGSGEDQCELIGGDENEAVTSGDFWDSPWAIGYSRAFASSSFQKGPIGFGPKDGSNWTGKYYPTWYECGVSVPGNSTVVDYVITSENEWDDVQFGQMEFLSDGEFAVPTGVTALDVVCIGGGGGGVDGHSAILGITADAGNGGNSTFGSYVWAEGGKGARLNSHGGEGGRGLTADGGHGGIGGGCSAGAGAAGQTSGGGGGLVPGSSTNPFCGAGGSSGGSSCGSEFENIDPGSSGPGGQDPVSRNGGLYGGGGGSRAGGRTGGGGGYSRSKIQVVPGQRISVTVGEYGTPHYARPGKGIVVVSWGGPIQPLGNFMN